MTSNQHKRIYATKASGKLMVLFPEKRKHSLKRSLADEATSKQIVDAILTDAIDGVSTQEKYKKAFSSLKPNSRQQAARYKLKHAIIEQGPTGFTLKSFIEKVFEQLEYKVKTGQIIKGEWVKHEVDIIGAKDNKMVFAEYKFQNSQGISRDMKISLYVHYRLRDIENQYQKQPERNGKVHEGWVVPNSHFAEDAMHYGTCAGLQLLGCDETQGNGLKHMIYKMALIRSPVKPN